MQEEKAKESGCKRGIERESECLGRKESQEKKDRESESEGEGEGVEGMGRQ